MMLVTLLGTVFFTALTFTPAGRLLGLTPLPLAYFGFLAIVVSLYLLWVTAWPKSVYPPLQASLL